MATRKPKPPAEMVALPATDFARLTQRMARLEKELKALRAQAVLKEPEPLVPTEEQQQQAAMRAAQMREARFGWTVTSNASADVVRLLNDRLCAGICEPRQGVNPEYEALRLHTASRVVKDVQEKFHNTWQESGPLAGQPWSQLPPQAARHMLLGMMRSFTVDLIERNQADMVLEDTQRTIQHLRPSVTFDRNKQAPTAIEEGVGLGYSMVLDVFDQLQADQPGLTQPDAEKISRKVMGRGVKTVQTCLAKYDTKFSEKPATHEELFAQCYRTIAMSALHYGLTFAGFGDEPLPPGVPPLRTAGAILTQMDIVQRPQPRDLTPEEQAMAGPENGDPAERVGALQIRELQRVIDVVGDSLYDGELQIQVQDAYARRAAGLFPREPLREMTQEFRHSGWRELQRTLKEIGDKLFRQQYRQDCWAKPGQALISRDRVMNASVRYH